MQNLQKSIILNDYYDCLSIDIFVFFSYNPVEG